MKAVLIYNKEGCDLGLRPCLSRENAGSSLIRDSAVVTQLMEFSVGDSPNRTNSLCFVLKATMFPAIFKMLVKPQTRSSSVAFQAEMGSLVLDLRYRARELLRRSFTLMLVILKIFISLKFSSSVNHLERHSF